tara:strand:- start:362 stop:553 length:192 start_codon:yes stop_codon:yes gene_type:complete
MLSEAQCKRLLKQTEEVLKTREELDILKEEWQELKGWMAALRLVLEVNGTSQIRDTPLEEEDG